MDLPDRSVKCGRRSLAGRVNPHDLSHGLAVQAPAGRDAARAVAKRSTVISAARSRACRRSYANCIPSHVSGVEPKAFDNRTAISAETPVRPARRPRAVGRAT